jgi:hypothetical protein
MASSGSSATGSVSYGGSVAGKGGYSSGTGKGSYSLAGAGSYGKNSSYSPSSYLTNYSKGIGTGYLSNMLSSYFKAKAGSFYTNSRGVKGDNQKDFKSFLELILRGRQPVYYTVDLKKKREIDLEEFLQKELKQYKRKCPSCGSGAAGRYSMN